MDKSNVQVLRWEIESSVRQHIQDDDIALALTNQIMLNVLDNFASQAVARNAKKKHFLTFRRTPGVTVPGWAYRKPGTVPGFPTLR